MALGGRLKNALRCPEWLFSNHTTKQRRVAKANSTLLASINTPHYLQILAWCTTNNYRHFLTNHEEVNGLSNVSPTIKHHCRRRPSVTCTDVENDLAEGSVLSKVWLFTEHGKRWALCGTPPEIDEVTLSKHFFFFFFSKGGKLLCLGTSIKGPLGIQLNLVIKKSHGE